MNQEIFIISLIFKSSDFGFRYKKFFFAVFGRYFTPWIRIRGYAYFCGSAFGSRKPKSCGSDGSGSLPLTKTTIKEKIHLQKFYFIF